MPTSPAKLAASDINVIGATQQQAPKSAGNEETKQQQKQEGEEPPTEAVATATATVLPPPKLRDMVPISSVDAIIEEDIRPRTIKVITLALACANAADAVEVLAVGFFLTVYKNSDGSELTSTDKSILTGSIYMGMLLGGVVGGWLSDVVGRRRTLTCSLALNGVAGLLSAWSPTLAWLATFRVLAGIGVGASVPCLFTLGAELFPVKTRGVYLSYIASFWMVGSIYAASAAWIILGENAQGERILPGWTWRAFVVAAALPVFITLTLTLSLLPESPRYLISKGRYAEAAKSLQKLTGETVSAEALRPAAGGGDDGLVDSLSRETDPLNNLRGVGNALNNDDGGSNSSDDGSDPSAAALRRPRHSQTQQELHQQQQPQSQRRQRGGEGGVVISHKGLDRIWAVFSGPMGLTTCRLMVIWFTLCFGTYGLSTWISTIFKDIGIKNEFLPTFFFALANGPGNLASFVLIERLGRKRLLAYSMLFAAGSAFLFAGTSAHVQWLAVIAACLFQAFSVAGWNSLDALSTESFPTATRTTGMGLLSGTGRFASLVAMFVNGSLEHSIALLFTVTGSMTILGAVAAFWLPYEPTGQSLDGMGGGGGGRRQQQDYNNLHPLRPVVSDERDVGEGGSENV